MQVAKFWRKNQLRYRMQGLVQNKADLSEVEAKITEEKKSEAEPPVKAKVA